MIISITSYKGGVGKTTTAINLAAYLNHFASTLLVDGDPNRSALNWARRGNLPFAVITEKQMVAHGGKYEHIVIDTEARPNTEDMKEIAASCDLVIVPTSPNAVALEVMLSTTSALKAFDCQNYAVLISIVPPRPNRDGEEARKLCEEENLPVLAGEIKRLIAFERAGLAGVPVSAVDDPRATDAWRCIERVGKEILDKKGIIYEQQVQRS